ncbi:phosphatase PAP2 family protein [Paenibacillus flagellatus]|uniref:Inositol phosphorylceramide synthase n=1 Tax=Paenibacillus flagellatus TaxID=2211139 RepID=A0A2V5K5Z7_9BACL|nr:phosphatase PAP2 family protein [Paenibacillus flagellatus]PYI53314.1 inositol phosphorylceramide synthase [Paenibacillus flagellatus]
MFTIQSMTHATVYIAITVYVLLFLSLKRHPLYPFHAAGMFVQELFTSRKYLLHFLGMVVILFFNKIEITLENNMKSHSDFTPSVYGLEGEFVAVFQRLFENGFLTSVLSFFYVVVFPALMITSIAIYTYERNYKLFRAVCYAMMINYMIAIPFYLFFPVTEVHAFNPNVRFLMLDAFPTFETDYRPLSDLDNCFPSLHTSISVSMAVIALRSKNGFWKVFAPVSAGIIIFSIFYLGIHWLMDMSAGMVLGLLAGRFGIRLSEGRSLFAGSRVDGAIKKRRNADGKW